MFLVTLYLPSNVETFGSKRPEGLYILYSVMLRNIFSRLLLRCAEGSLLNDSEVQKAALHVICNCVCGPRVRVSGLCAFRLSSLPPA